MEKFKYLPVEKISQLPKTSGVYAFKKGREFLYIGKAQNIRDRTKQHGDLLTRSKHIAYIKTGSEIEALILEAELIKKHQPKYNVMWRDDKNYFYICITKEDFPRIFITHQLKNAENSSRYLGPFVDGRALKETLKVLRKVFPYRTCKNLPKKPCLWYQLDRCPAPCLVHPQVPGFKEKIKKECQRNAKNLLKILQGEKTQVLRDLKKEMKKLSKEEEFEEAAKIRNQIKALEKIMSHAKIFELAEIGSLTAPNWPYRRIEAYDVSNIQGKEATGSMVTFINGKPAKNFYRKFKIKIAGRPNDVAMIKEILRRRLQHPEWPYPDLILIDGGGAQFNAAISVTKIKVMALAKKENKLYIEGQKQPVLLKDLPRKIFNLILQLRDEAHRFAKKYHHHLREKTLIR
jgi:excinuclease ABC subunit C